MAILVLISFIAVFGLLTLKIFPWLRKQVGEWEKQEYIPSPTVPQVVVVMVYRMQPINLN